MFKGLKFSIFAEDKFTAAFQSLRKNLDATKAKFSGMKEAFGGFGSALAAALGGAAIKSIIDAADRIDKLSLKLGISAEELSRLKFAGEQTGVSFDQMSEALGKMGVRIAEASRGGGAAANSLKELGLNAAALQTLSPDRQFNAIADALAGIQSQSDKARLAMTLFEEGGVALIQTMDGGSAAVNALKGQLDALGGTTTQLQATSLASINDAWNRMNVAVQGLARSFVTALAPAIVGMSDLITKFIPQINVFNHLTDKIALGGIKVMSKIGLIDEEMANFAADEVMERIHNDTKNVNEALESQLAALDKIDARMRGLPASPTMPRLPAHAPFRAPPLETSPFPVLKPSAPERVDPSALKRDTYAGLSDGFRLADRDVSTFGDDLRDAAKEGLKEAFSSMTAGRSEGGFNFLTFLRGAVSRAGEKQLDGFVDKGMDWLGKVGKSIFSPAAAAVAGKVTTTFPSLSLPEGEFGPQPNQVIGLLWMDRFSRFETPIMSLRKTWLHLPLQVIKVLGYDGSFIAVPLQIGQLIFSPFIDSFPIICRLQFGVLCL